MRGRWRLVLHASANMVDVHGPPDVSVRLGIRLNRDGPFHAGQRGDQAGHNAIPVHAFLGWGCGNNNTNACGYLAAAES